MSFSKLAASLVSARMNPTSFALLLAGLTAVAALGCGGEAKRYHVSGKVTWKDAPVKFGHVTFVPLVGKTNNGFQGDAPIRDGTYDTKSGLGVAGTGPFLVRIDGFDGKANGEQPLGSPTFSHEEEVTLSGADLTKDFVVPATAPKTAPQKKIIVP
jgi:hypothetical protein